MRIAFLACMVALMLLLLVLGIKYNFRKNAFKHKTFLLDLVIIVMSSLYLVALFTRYEGAALAFMGAYRSIRIVLQMQIIHFLMCYCSYENLLAVASKGVKRIYLVVMTLITILVIVDIGQSIINIWNKQLFTVNIGIELPYGILNQFAYNGWSNTLHILIEIIFYAFLIIMLIHKTMISYSFYRPKYFTALFIILLNLILDFSSELSGLSINLSLFSYLILGIFFSWYPSVYMRKELISQILVASVEEMNSGVLCFDADGKCVYVNKYIYNIFKQYYEDEEQIGAAYLKQVGITELSSNTPTMICHQQTLNGKVIYIEISQTPMMDRNGHFLGNYFMAIDRTEEQQKLQKEKYDAEHDSLTGLYNRRKFMAELKQITENELREKYYLLYLDIRDFKLANELFGPKTGDEYLQKIASVLRTSLGTECLYCRLEADHFAVCIPDHLYKETVFLNDIRSAESFIKTEIFNATVCIGVYIINDEILEPSIMLDRASMAMRTIKGDTMRKIAYFDEEMMNKLLTEKKLTNELDTAIKTGQFHMYLQAQTDAEGKMLGAEALTRWIMPDKGMISPGTFIPVFEKTGVIYKMDEYIWEQACITLRKWEDMGLPQYHISVNISAKDFYYIDIYKTMTGLVEKYGIEPRKLKLEITESAFMYEFEKQLKLIDRLREYGFEIEIDDFGSGYSFLNMLKDIRADVLKIDMGFLKETSRSDRSKKILEMVIRLSKSLEMPIVVEGVERKEQLDFLKELDCDMYQGYYFCRPIPVSEFESKYFQ